MGCKFKSLFVQVKKEAERMKKEAIVMGAKALKSILERKNS